MTPPNSWTAVVESCAAEDGFAWLAIDSGRLAARLWPGIAPGDGVDVRVRPEDVVLCSEPPGQVSTRNVLPGRVTRVQVGPDGSHVTLDVGFPLVALVTRRTVREMALAPGREVLALVKATAVVPRVEVALRLRAGVVGPDGEIPPRRLELLRAIHATGSLTAAARSCGVTYRTGWLWAQAANEAWGAPLVVPSQGGVGGGGAVLTREALALLERVDALEAGATLPDPD